MSPLNDGPVSGLRIDRTVLFSVLKSEYDWHVRVLVAIEAAKALGVPVIEIDVRNETREIPVNRPSGSSMTGMQTYTYEGMETQQVQRITLYAVRVSE